MTLQVDPPSWGKEENVGLLATNDEVPNDGRVHRRSTGFFMSARKNLPWVILAGVLIVSLITNGIQFWSRRDMGSVAGNCIAPISRLALNEPIDFGGRTEFGNVSDLTALDNLWLGMDTAKGVVQLPKELHLGSSENFPWDESRALYVLNSYHSLHCLRTIYTFVRSCSAKQQLVGTFPHIVHCLDVLRSDIMCQADDTPIPFSFQKHAYQGERMPKRMCRDWAKFESFATRNSACFERRAADDPLYGTIHQYLNCPVESPFYELAEQIKSYGT